MQIRTDRTKRVDIEIDTLPWVPSPERGVERRLLERDGDEDARATTIIRFPPNGTFLEHVHEMGEELLVLEGMIGDELGRYPKYTYVRNPWGSRHRPFTNEGCTLFVKLRQMDADDTERVVRFTEDELWEEVEDGLCRKYLHRFGNEEVFLERADRGYASTMAILPGGEESLVLDGSFADEAGVCTRGTWSRIPAGTKHAIRSANGGLRWVKRGHL
jgi:hypothetical protein